MKPTCGNRGCTREAEFERDWEHGGQTVKQLRCSPCAWLHVAHDEFRPIEGREAEVA